MTRRPNLADIASAVGVSTSAVSLALRGRARVSEETAERIRREADRLGYVQNKTAAGLRTARSEIVGVCLNDLSNPVFNEFLVHVEAELRAENRWLFLGVARESLDLQSAILRNAIAHGVGGMLICPVRGTTAADLAPLLPFEGRPPPCPAAILSRTLDDVPLPQFANDDRLAGQLMAHRLHAAGHDEIHWIGGGHDSSTARDRFAGLTEALSQIGGPPPVAWFGPTTRRFGYEVAERILTGGAGVGVACFSDLLAFGVLAACANFDRIPGRDLSVIGCDDMEEASFTYPSLSSVWIDKAWIGRSSTRSVTQPDQAEPRITRVDPTIMERQTLCPPIRQHS